MWQKGLIQDQMKVNQWKSLNISSFILKGKKKKKKQEAHERTTACRDRRFFVFFSSKRRWSVCVVRGNVVCGAHSAHVTGVAEEMRVQREALRAGLVGELLTTLLKERENKVRNRNTQRKWGHTSRTFTQNSLIWTMWLNPNVTH